MSKQKQIDQLEFRVAEMTKINMLYPRLKEHFNDLQAKYEAVCAELEAAQGEIDAAKKRISELEKENGALQIAFDSCLKEDDARRIEAEAIRKQANYLEENFSFGWDGDCGIFHAMNDYANKLERGEL